MVKKFFEMYCLEHSCFILKCSIVCHPAEFIHVSYALLLRMAHVAGTDQPMCSLPSAELSKRSVQNSSRWMYYLLRTHVSLMDHFIASACSVCTLIDTL